MVERRCPSQRECFALCTLEEDRRLQKILYVDMRYQVKLRKTDEGYVVWCPALPGCWSQGVTEDEALENIKDAIQAYLSVRSHSDTRQ